MSDVQSAGPRPIDALPLGEARLARPEVVVPLSFDHLLHHRGSARKQLGIIPIEAVQTGDTQVFAAREDGKYNAPKISLDVLAGFPTVRSVVTSTSVEARVPLPSLAELLFVAPNLMPDALTIENLTGLESLYAAGAYSNVRIALDRLPSDRMRQLSIPRWAVQDIDAVRKLTQLQELATQLYPADSLEPISTLHNLTYLRVSCGKAWASLRDCIKLEEAHLIDVGMANLRRLGTWKRLRRLVLTGARLKSLSGIEQFENLRSLTLIMVGCKDLDPLGALTRLTELTLRHVAASRNLSALSGLSELVRLTMDQSVGSNRDIITVETLRPLAGLQNLQELTMLGTNIGDGDLSPLIGLPKLRKVVLGRYLEADVDKLKLARPDIEIDHHLPPAKQPGVVERVGQITIHGPMGESKQWSIYEELTDGLGVKTNHAAEQALKRTMKKVAPDLLRRVEFDTEGDGVAVFAEAEMDIRAVAKILDGMLRPKL